MGVRRIALVLAVLGSLGALSGCSLSKTVDPVASAATKTENAGGVRMKMSMAFSVASQSFTMTADGVFDKGQGDMTMDMSSLLAQAGLPAGSGGNIELRYLMENGDYVMYMNMPFLAAMIPGGKAWIRFDLNTALSGLGVNFQQLMSQANADPSQLLDMLRASGSVQTVGTETIGGLATTHYKATIDVGTVLDKIGGSSGQALVDRLKASGLSSIPVDVWVGDDGLVRRETIDMSVPSGSQTVGANITVDFSDYGTDVSVTAPPADQVTDLTALLAQAGQGAGTPTTAPTATPAYGG